MAVKVLITRKFKKNTIKEAYKALMELRAMVTVLPGYLSGQTLISAEDPHKLLVISTWVSKKRWEDWQATETRKKFQKKLADLLETPEQSEIYYVGEKEPEWVDMA
ncbi:MAG TPA: antibiotic biosynthesis monooxygenase [Desulfomonilaceae bacterium]|nr:antibiotic biosynthesis monooxygenase [Desulfomonilaceae bacterium]